MALRLPEGIAACLLDLDGVVTETAVLHAAAWKQMFDEYLAARASRSGVPLVAFDPVADYDAFVDGRPRLEGTREFLRSRDIELPEGRPTDPAGAETVNGLASRKNDLLLDLIDRRGVAVYPGSLRFLHEARRLAIATAVVSSSANTLQVLRAGELVELFDAVVDGLVAEAEHLKGKPAPDTYLAAAQRLAVAPEQAAVFEDAQVGVEAGRAGRFGLVVGVDRGGRHDALVAHGADLVVTDLAELVG